MEKNPAFTICQFPNKKKKKAVPSVFSLHSILEVCLADLRGAQDVTEGAASKAQPVWKPTQHHQSLTET